VVAAAAVSAREFSPVVFSACLEIPACVSTSLSLTDLLPPFDPVRLRAVHRSLVSLNRGIGAAGLVRGFERCLCCGQSSVPDLPHSAFHMRMAGSMGDERPLSGAGFDALCVEPFPARRLSPLLALGKHAAVPLEQNRRGLSGHVALHNGRDVGPHAG
jgi:hypothetical protein